MCDVNSEEDREADRSRIGLKSPFRIRTENQVYGFAEVCPHNRKLFSEDRDEGGQVRSKDTELDAVFGIQLRASVPRALHVCSDIGFPTCWIDPAWSYSIILWLLDFQTHDIWIN